MSSLSNRQKIAASEQFYLCPLPLMGETAPLMPGWIDAGIEQDSANELTLIHRENDEGKTVLVAKAYELERPLIDAKASKPGVMERVMIVNSPT